MKELYSTSKGSDLNYNYSFLRISSIKAVSLGVTAAILLSSVSSVSAANLAIAAANSYSTVGGSVKYEYGSQASVVISGDNNHCGADRVIGRGGPDREQEGAITAAAQYDRFVKDTRFDGDRNIYGTNTSSVAYSGIGRVDKTSGYMSEHTGGDNNVMPIAYGVYSFVTGCGAYASGNYSTAFGSGATALSGGAMSFGVSSLASGRVSVAMGVGSEATAVSASAFGGLARAAGEQSSAFGFKAYAKTKNALAMGSEARAEGDVAIAVGRLASAKGPDSVAFGVSALAAMKSSIALGSNSNAGGDSSIAIGDNAQTTVSDGVAIGSGSASVTAAGVVGRYAGDAENPYQDSSLWVSTKGAVSIGDFSKGITRQLKGVAAGTKHDDAVNVAQLIATENWARRQLKSAKEWVKDGFTTIIGVDGSPDKETWTAPTFQITQFDSKGAANKKQYKNIVEAFKGTDTALVSLNTNINTIKKDFLTTSENVAKALGGGAAYSNGKWTEPSFGLVQITSGGKVSEKQN
ncbi:hypothetical protein NPY00_05715, partial [Bartonella sp. F2]|nr:hypothetical protein [Bartonella sp. F02]